MGLHSSIGHANDGRALNDGQAGDKKFSSFESCHEIYQPLISADNIRRKSSAVFVQKGKYSKATGFSACKCQKPRRVDHDTNSLHNVKT